MSFWSDTDELKIATNVKKEIEARRCRILQEIGFWTWPEEPVNTVNPDNWASDKKQENLFARLPRCAQLPVAEV